MPTDSDIEWHIYRIWQTGRESYHALEYEIPLVELFRMHEVLDIEMEMERQARERAKLNGNSR